MKMQSFTAIAGAVSLALASSHAAFAQFVPTNLDVPGTWQQRAGNG